MPSDYYAEMETMLTAMEPRDELVRRWAIMKVAPRYMLDGRWKRRVLQLVTMLRLNEAGVAAAMREADRVAEQLREDMASGV
jgi:hypothetical protein